ncbi:MAG: sigma-54 dependent transcriptional regulator [Myxococcota bacterium]
MSGEQKGIDRPPQPVAASPSMQQVLRQVHRLAPIDVPVLILGETGTGKEVIARAIHHGGPRAEHRLGCVNCGALPEHLVESILFGHEKGAFTGAENRQEGVFEASDGGTVLLDEIGELPPSAQAALLRVLETKRVTRVGGTSERAVDVRFLAATHRNLEAMCTTGAFRWDLYYRLNVMSLQLTPLRFRVPDIRPLAERFLTAAETRIGLPSRRLGAETVRMLEAYDWPGNVRELKNVVERAAVVAEGETVATKDLPEQLRAAAATQELPSPPKSRSAPRDKVDVPSPRPSKPPSGGARPVSSAPETIQDYKTQMQQAEIEVIVRALRRTQLNQTEAARLLRMPLRTLVHKMKVLDIRRILAEQATDERISP